MPRLVVVTGAFGFIGSHVCRSLAEQGITVYGLGHGPSTHDSAGASAITRRLEADVSSESLAELARQEVPDAIIHCPGGGSVAQAFAAPLTDFERSVSSVAAILEYARLLPRDRTRVVLTSSAAVYGDQGEIDFSEGDKCFPISPYGFNRQMAEELCISYAKFFDMRISIVRLFSVHGEGLKKQLLWDAANKFERNTPKFFGTGLELRDWIHVEDAARLLAAAASHPQGNLEVFNGGAFPANTEQVLTLLGDGLCSSLSPEFTGEVHAQNPRRMTANCTLARSRLGWSPKVRLADGIARYATWFKQREYI